MGGGGTCAGGVFLGTWGTADMGGGIEAMAVGAAEVAGMAMAGDPASISAMITTMTTTAATGGTAAGTAARRTELENESPTLLLGDSTPLVMPLNSQFCSTIPRVWS